MGRREVARGPRSRQCRAGSVEPGCADPRRGRAARRVRRSALVAGPHWSRQLNRETRSRRPPRARVRAQRPVSRQDLDALVQVREECRVRGCDQPNALVASRTGFQSPHAQPAGDLGGDGQAETPCPEAPCRVDQALEKRAIALDVRLARRPAPDATHPARPSRHSLASRSRERPWCQGGALPGR